MVNALCDRVEAKTAKYAAKPNGIQQFQLLVHYDKAFQYNTPVEGVNFSYGEAVAAAADRIGNAVGVFDKIFVYVPTSNGQKVFRMYP
jgi:hypothetical protein